MNKSELDDRVCRIIRRTIEEENAKDEVRRQADPVSRRGIARFAAWLRDIKHDAKYRPFVIEDEETDDAKSKVP